MAYKSSDYPKVKVTSDAYNVAKAARLKAQRAFDETSTKSPNYAKVNAALEAAKTAEAAKLKAYKSTYDAAKADYNKKSTIKKSETDIKSSNAIITSINEQIKKAQDSGQSTKVLDARLKAIEIKLAAALKATKTVAENRPIGVPYNAKFNSVTGQYTLGSETWDKNGKKVTSPAKGVYTTKDGLTYFDGKLFSGDKDGKTYKNGKIAKPATGVYTTKNGITYLDGKPYSGEKDGKTYKDGKVVVPPKKTVTGDDGSSTGDKGGPAIDGGGEPVDGTANLTPFDEILAKAKETYGDIDSVFNDDPDLRKLLRDAIGNVADVNDDMKDSEFLVRLKATTWWQTSAGPVRQRGFEKRQYLRLKAEIEKNPSAADYQTKLDKLENENSYARGLANAKGLLKFVTNQEGLNVTDEELTKIAGGLYDFANENNDISRLDALSRFVTANGLTEGPTGKALRSLRATARANGVDLNDAAGGNLNTWLQKMFKGKDIADYEQLIRDKAGQNQSKYVKDLLAAGNDLRSIYDPFIREMATSFGIVDINSIDLNDPLLKGAFTENGAINSTQFKNLLRTDKRFTNTPAAIDEGNVEGQARQQLARIAQDNGFNLDVDFKDQIGGWLARVKNGESIELIGQAIRDKAATERGQYVAGLLKSGYNLNGIYGNYINLMSQYFNVDPETISENDPLLQKVFDDKGGLTFAKFEALLRSDDRYKGTKAEGQQKDFSQSIADRALTLGVTLGQKEIDEIVNNALSMGISASSTLVDGLIRAKFTYAPGTSLGGAAGGALAKLKSTAAANGIDFDAQFGKDAQTWLSKILQGESTDTYDNIIRQTAERGLPDNVKALLKLGVNLDTVYAPYKNIMASVLGLNPQTIGVNDKTLRSAIGPDKEMTLYDWERSLRKDARWQYTDNARQEVAGIGLNVLQQLGFQG